ncbi:MAG: branched-chain amino acid ABC transporter permease, partial [Gammaproteobacteria bacterium]|nr:branched-chain amino acid ABC transporter permease [Gammaproteobacteria bacterium]
LGVWPPSYLDSKAAFYYMALVLSGLSILFLRHVIFSPFGYALRAARDNPKRAASVGLNLRVYQWIGLTFSGAFAGLAGGIFAYAKGSVFPTTLDIMTSLDAFVMTLIGGLNTLAGPVVGSLVYTWLESEISRHTELWRAILGLIILSVVIFLPQGLVGHAQSGWQRLRRRARRS